MKTYFINAALHQETRNGEVWTYDKFITRLISIKSPSSGKVIIATYRYIDNNFENIYNIPSRNPLEKEKSVIIDDYYRNKLHINKNEETLLDIRRVGKYDIINNVKYLIQHPNDSIRIATWLAIISIGISVIPVIVGWIYRCVNIFECLIHRCL